MGAYVAVAEAMKKRKGCPVWQLKIPSLSEQRYGFRRLPPPPPKYLPSEACAHLQGNCGIDVARILHCASQTHMLLEKEL